MEEIITCYPAYVNKNLDKATKDIFKIGETMRKCAFTTAVIIANVDEMECYKEDGFNNVHEWVSLTFGFKKSASYSLLKIGKEYVREVINPKNGKVTGYVTNLLPENSDSDFTTTQLEKMLPVGHEKALELVTNGEITPDMTCKEISKIIKKHTVPEEATDTEPEEATDTEPEENIILSIIGKVLSIGERVLEFNGKVINNPVEFSEVIQKFNDFMNGK